MDKKCKIKKKVKNGVSIIGGDEGTIRFYKHIFLMVEILLKMISTLVKILVVLGMDVVDSYFLLRIRLVKKIKFDGLDYFVIGTTERQGEAFGESKDNFIAIPISTFIGKFSDKWSSIRIHVEFI